MTARQDLQARHLRARAIHSRAGGDRADPGRPRPAPWVTVTGGKGGVGKTLIAVNLSLLAARAGYRTLLLDLDPGLANVDVHLRLHPTHAVEDVLSGACPLDPALLTGPSGLRVLAGRSGSTRLLETDGTALGAALQALAPTVRDFDLVVCDTGAGIGPAVMAALQRADLALAVTQPDPSSVTDTYALCKLLQQRARPLPGLVFNRVRSRDEALSSSGKLAAVCRRFLDREPPLLGWLREDRAIEQSVRTQHPFALLGAGEPLEDLRALLACTTSRLPGLRRGGKAGAPGREAGSKLR